jgi:hypothetical protein
MRRAEKREVSRSEVKMTCGSGDERAGEQSLAGVGSLRAMGATTNKPTLFSNVSIINHRPPHCYTATDIDERRDESAVGTKLSGRAWVEATIFGLEGGWEL